ncbi:MAG: RagB/SusD family nutrient uptake outer membrane protein [Gemmatimonadaceae bacterium]
MRGLARAAVSVAAVALASLAACSDASKILDQEAPSRVDASTLDNPAYAQLLVNGAIGDFECALGNYIIAGGLVGDELIDAQLGQAGWDYDRRTIFSGSIPYSTTQCGANQAPGLYTPVSVARFQADNALRRLQAWTDAQVTNRQSLIAQAATYAGYSLVLLGEAMCSAAIDLGPEMSRAQLFAAAQDRFTTAIAAAQASSNSVMLNAARIGRARALLDQGKLQEARADAVLVTDPNFVLNASYSAANGRRENLVWSQMYRGLFSSVDPSYRGVTYAGVADPRVRVVNANATGQDRVTPIWQQTKYPLISSPIPVARYAEAQLIVAEADNANNNTANAIAIINALHAKAGIPAYTGGATQAEVQAQIIEERRREFFLEGQHLGDIIRYNLQVVPVKGTAFKNGGSYGNDTGIQLCFPLPDIERNNNPSIAKTS